MVEGELEHDQQRGRERGDLDQGLALGTKAKAIEANASQGEDARCGAVQARAWPQMLNGETRPAWLAIVLS